MSRRANLLFVAFVPPQTQAVVNQRPPETQKNQSKNRLWTGVLGITLVEGQDLPQYGQGDIYVRFRLGDQKYKSKVGRLLSYFPPLFSILLFSFLMPTLYTSLSPPLPAGCISLPAGVCQ